MTTSSMNSDQSAATELLEVVRRYWGFAALRPLQASAMQAFLSGRDSLLVLPTGGGKSLCYQAPALVLDELTVVVSPLISLMKDQVDGLHSCGIKAVQLNSSMKADELRRAEQSVRDGSIKLVFASPERLATSGFRSLLRQAQVRRFAIDEAHCISHWGHDFRPEYRQLGRLKELFPEASIHACTATATTQVRADIVAQLQLADPEILVGNFDRPNLTYSVIQRDGESSQIMEILRRHPGEAGIIYCISRREVDETAAFLRARKVNARAYHAGMEAAARKRVHDLFTAEKCDVVVATVAFGMGIDRSNIRFVIHTGMPKSIEHYQQETGRAGRDGLEAECVLLYAARDSILWKKIVQKSIDESENEVSPEYLENVYRHLADMEGYCRPTSCRHKYLVEYFGQKFESDNCGACDLCLNPRVEIADSTVIAKKILSCVYRVEEKFGVSHTAAVLRGANKAAIRERGHDRLSTYGLMRENSQQEIVDWIHQLVGAGLATLTEGEYPILKLNAASWDLLKDRREAILYRLPSTAEEEVSEKSSSSSRRSRGASASWDGVDQPLFERLRALRRQEADERKIPPYVVFGDETLRELARIRPSSLAGMSGVYGIGESKFGQFGAVFFAAIDEECRSRGLSRDRPPIDENRSPASRSPKSKPGSTAAQGIELFRQGASIEVVMERTGRARSTAVQYLCQFIESEPMASISRWVSDASYSRVAQAAEKIGIDKLTPLYEMLGGEVTYDEIKLAATHLAMQGSPSDLSQN